MGSDAARAGAQGDAPLSATRRSGRQLILLSVLVVVYVFNIKFLPLRGEGVTFFLANVIPFVNLILAGFVLASIAARFIFPNQSRGANAPGLLRSSPLEMRQLLWSKFWVGTIPLLAPRTRAGVRDGRNCSR